VTPPAPQARFRVDGPEVRHLDEGWELAAAGPDEEPTTAGLDGLGWVPARVPGTVAAALGDSGRDLDAEDWWFRTSFEAEPAAAGEEVLLHLGGIATVAEVHLNGERILESESMFLEHALEVGSLLCETNELTIRCRALGPLLAPRRRPRARWRTRLVSESNLRFFRTTLLGRAPGFAPGPAAVGPWRPVTLERTRGLAVDEIALRPRLEGSEGKLAVRASLRALDGSSPSGVDVEASGPSGAHRTALALREGPDGALATGELSVPDVAPWWPHTHGEPALYEVRLVVETREEAVAVDAGRTGFRRLDAGGVPAEEGLALRVNGVPVFARGAVWTPVDPVGLAPDSAELRSTLERARAGGMNMVRVVGTAAYESPEFHDLCDRLGILVWQDFMFANFDYPIADEGFRALVEQEAIQLLGRVAGRPSLAVLCGNSEVEQQAAMMGQDPALGRGELFGELLPRLVQEAGVDAAYLPSAPCGGDLPFRSDRGVANYFGVGGYRRPLEDARRAELRFASECLAFANVPDEVHIRVHDPRWKAGVPRDAGSGWDFDDVRDHYLELLYGVDAVELRSVDHERYLELSRSVTGEVMAETFSEWRRAASPCGGGLVLWLRDLAPGAGWGLLDHRGEAKVAYHHLRRALAPVAVSMTDEGLNGVDVHVVNDRPEPLAARLRVSLYRDLEQRVEEGEQQLELGPHGAHRVGVEEVVGHFVDAAWAYRFGPPAQDLIVASLEGGGSLLSQVFLFPAGRPARRESATELGLGAEASPAGDGIFELAVRSRRLAYGVRVRMDGFDPSDDAFCVEPGRERRLRLVPREPGAQLDAGILSALNLEGRVRVTVGEGAG